MTPKQHAALLLELANRLEDLCEVRLDDVYDLIARARAAAAELEGQKVPTIDEIHHIIAISASSRSAARVIAARFGGGEVQE